MAHVAFLHGPASLSAAEIGDNAGMSYRIRTESTLLRRATEPGDTVLPSAAAAYRGPLPT